VSKFPYFGELSPFYIGMLGSISVEIYSALNDCVAINGMCPERYKRFPYIVFRVLMAGIGGTLATLLDAPSSLTAFYIGASAPLLLDRMAHGVKPDEMP
jgi:hypothetical protein